MRAAKQAECQSVNQAAREAQEAYKSAVMEASAKLHAEARTAEQRAAIEADNVRAEIANIEAELARLER